MTMLGRLPNATAVFRLISLRATTRPQRVQKGGLSFFDNLDTMWTFPRAEITKDIL